MGSGRTVNSSEKIDVKRIRDEAAVGGKWGGPALFVLNAVSLSKFPVLELPLNPYFIASPSLIPCRLRPSCHSTPCMYPSHNNPAP